MYAYSTENDGVDSYQRSVRDRANASLHDLDEVLAHSPNASLNTSTRAKEQLEEAVHPRHLRWYEAEARPKKYKDAVSHLQQMLHDHEEEKSPFYQGPNYTVPPRPPQPTGSLPTAEEAANLLQSQTSYLQQLEAENRYMKNEFASIRIKIKDVLDENQKLHEELRKSVLEEILAEDDDVLQRSDLDKSAEAGNLNASMTRGNLRQWQIELEKLSALHSAKTERLELQLQHSREEIQKYEQMVEELRGQLRLHDAIPTREDGYTDMYTSETQRGYHKQVIDRLTKERDDLMEHVAGLKGKLREMAQREEQAYQQMKKGIELVEQAQFEQTQAMVQKEQLSEELTNMKHRFDEHIESVQQKIQHERDTVRGENKAVVAELSTKIAELTEQSVAAQNQLEKVTRDKVSLINELEVAKLHIKQYDKEVSLVTDNFNAESTNAKIQKSRAEGEVSRLRLEVDNLRRERDQDRSRTGLELDDLRRRLNKAERELVNSKEECIHLTTTSQALERELHIAKLARDSVERGRSEDMKAMVKRSEAREEELNGFITELEEKHSQTTSDMDAMLSKQNKLINKLKNECRRQAAQIESIMKKHRSENGKLRRHNEELRNRLQRSVSHLKDLEDQTEQHARVQEKMTERLKMMDDHAQHQGQQVLELLTKQSSLMRDRQVLARELEFLRRNISKRNEDEISNFVSSNKLLVDEVLENIRVENKDKKETYITKSALDVDDLI